MYIDFIQSDIILGIAIYWYVQQQVGDLLKKLEAEVCKDGAWVENKGVLLTYHYRYIETRLLINIERLQ